MLRCGETVVPCKLLRKLVTYSCELTIICAVSEHYPVILGDRYSVLGKRPIKERILELTDFGDVFLTCDKLEGLLVNYS